MPTTPRPDRTAGRTGGAGEPTEIAACPMCGAADGRPVHAFPPFGIARCRDCGFWYLSPRLPEAAMREVYASSEYFEGGEVGYLSYADQEAAQRATFRALVGALVERGLAGGDLLEIGSGYGFFLEAARGAFSTLSGTELSLPAAEAARARGLDVVTGGLEALPPGATYDTIVGGHVVEHVYDPRGFALELVDRLRPGGTVVLGTPDVGSAWRLVLGRRWPSFKIPEHVGYYDRTSLARLLADAGLSGIEPFPYPHAFPLGLIAGRLGLGPVARRLGRLGRRPVWVPGTTLALRARRPGRDEDARDRR